MDVCNVIATPTDNIAARRWWRMLAVTVIVASSVIMAVSSILLAAEIYLHPSVDKLVQDLVSVWGWRAVCSGMVYSCPTSLLIAIDISKVYHLEFDS